MVPSHVLYKIPLARQYSQDYKIMLLSFITINLSPSWRRLPVTARCFSIPTILCMPTPQLAILRRQPLGKWRTRDVHDKNLVCNVCSSQKPDEFSPLRMLWVKEIRPYLNSPAVYSDSVPFLLIYLPVEIMITSEVDSDSHSVWWDTDEDLVL